MAHFEKLLLIGCGNMGGAMLAGWLAAGEDPARFEVLDPALGAAPEGVKLHREPPADSDHDCVLLGFKPQQLGELGPRFQDLTGPGVTVFSLLAGIDLAMLRAAFPGADAHVRVMPNLAARIGKSPIIMAQSGLEPAASDAALALYDKLGTALWLDDESKFNLATALAGSGPGFVYRFIDALAAAGHQLGLDQGLADDLAMAMVEGASALAAAADISPGELADRVASPGGMTREGLNVLDADNALINLLNETLQATAAKGDELAANATASR
ncbi:pyrroline-5-carboxylate reductase dimerization domain-containing protein [Altererythrobacter arenosus]|uniref:Pyrroline-5-carboxylate reductase n=1 Tax=Altererythrobacter arenosus TaxID=3032592 RepID=A0ABY8FSI9_9SPHN|nr:pyrroline-5-carboxylate reductase dimerization domain-containing protein [Altererythrobacter sp. CAU 1644]WFL77981.1 pyrroline-5-carboxylate reductase dimerization domain-containing protein [Altererythrobacter sp. CAU 1644]